MSEPLRMTRDYGVSEVTGRLDSIAGALESAGLSHLAAELDKVSNELELDSYIRKTAGVEEMVPLDEQQDKDTIIHNIQDAVSHATHVQEPVMYWAYKLQNILQMASDPEYLSVGQAINKDLHQNARPLMALEKQKQDALNVLKTSILHDLDSVPEIKELIRPQLDHAHMMEATAMDPTHIVGDHVKGVIDDFMSDVKGIANVASSFEASHFVEGIFRSLQGMMGILTKGAPQEKDAMKGMVSKIVSDHVVQKGLDALGSLLKKEGMEGKHRVISNLMKTVDPKLSNLLDNKGQEVPLDQS